MRFKNISDIDGLFQVIDQCKGRVDIVTNDMVLNLKSDLAKYFVLAQAFSDGVVKDMELVAFNQEDRERLIEFMMNGRR